MKRIVIGLWIALLFFVLTSSTIWAQATAQISGAVRDQTGAVLAGVEITATQTETGVTRMTVTNETGAYVLSNITDPNGVRMELAELPPESLHRQAMERWK